MTAKSKAQLMRELRQRRKDLDLVEFRAWVTKEQKQKLVDVLKGEG